MPEPQPIITSAGPRFRRFAAFPVAVQAIILNEREEILLMNSPTRNQGWQVVSGALEAGESVLDGTLREVREELGPAIQVRPLGTVHAGTFRYDSEVPHMLEVYTLFSYQGGEAVPGDDMRGSEVRWWQVSELANAGVPVHATVKIWMLERAVQLFRIWRGEMP